MATFNNNTNTVRNNDFAVKEEAFYLPRQNAQWVMSQTYRGDRFELVNGDSKALRIERNDDGTATVIIPGSGINYEQLGRALVQSLYYNISKEGRTMILTHKTVKKQRRVTLTDAGTLATTYGEWQDAAGAYAETGIPYSGQAICETRNKIKDVQAINKWVIAALLLNPKVTVRIEAKSFKAARDFIIVGYRKEWARLVGHKHTGYITSRMERFGGNNRRNR